MNPQLVRQELRSPFSEAASMDNFVEQAKNTPDRLVVLPRNAAEIENTRQDFIRFMEGNLSDILFLGARIESGQVRFIGASIPSFIAEELKSMALTYHNIHGETAMNIEIRRDFKRMPHDHDWNVLNRVFGAPGTGIITKNGAIYTPEGSWLHIPKGIKHIPYMNQTTDNARITVAVYSP